MGVFRQDFVEQQAEFPAGLVNGEPGMLIRFRVHNAKSPEELGLGMDSRRLGLLVRSLQIEAKESE